MARSRLAVVPAHVEQRILLLRGERVMLDADLAELYGVETRALTQAVKRNRRRFPDDFMFQLTPDEAALLRSQTVISKAGRGGRRYAPFAVTEHSVAMLAAVLQSSRAVQVSIEIVRAFVRLRAMLAGNVEFARKLAVQSRCLTRFASTWRFHPSHAGGADSCREGSDRGRGLGVAFGFGPRALSHGAFTACDRPRSYRAEDPAPA